MFIHDESESGAARLLMEGLYETAKVLAPLLAAGMLFGLAACSAPQESGEDGTYQVGIIQQMEHTALNSATEGFKAALTEKLGDKVEFDYQNAQGEVSNCGTIASKFVSSNVDLILANATSALQAAYSATADDSGDRRID